MALPTGSRTTTVGAVTVPAPRLATCTTYCAGCPSPAAPGCRVRVSCRSATENGGTSRLARLLARFGSTLGTAATAANRCSLAVPGIVSCALSGGASPRASALRLHVKAPALPAHCQPLPEGPCCTTAPVGSTSDTPTTPATSGPVLLTCTVYIAELPAATTSGSRRSRTATSEAGPPSQSVARLFCDTGSLGPAAETAPCTASRPPLFGTAEATARTPIGAACPTASIAVLHST